MWIWHSVGGRNGSLVVSIFRRWKATAPRTAILFKYLKPWCVVDERSTVARCGLMAFKCFSEIQTTSENYPKTTPHKWIHVIAMYAISSACSPPPFLWLHSKRFSCLHSIETEWHKPSFCVAHSLQSHHISTIDNSWIYTCMACVFISTILLRRERRKRKRGRERGKMKDKK